MVDHLKDGELNFEEFYHNRVLQFDRERKIFHEYVHMITPDRNESHNLEWENKKLMTNAEEVKLEVNQYVKEAERVQKQITDTMTELHSLKSARDSRTEQISRLQKLTNPVQHDMTYLVEERFTARPEESRTGVPIQKLGTISGSYKPIKTGEILKLEQRLQDETVKASTYQQDLIISIREAEEERHRCRKMTSMKNVSEMKEAEALYMQVDEIEAQCFLSVSELLRLRVNIMVAQREEVEQLEHLQRDKAFFVAKEEKMRQQLISDMTLMQKRVKNELQDSTRDFQKQIAALNVKLNELKNKEEWVRRKRVKKEDNEDSLLEMAELARSRYTKLRRRHALEMEGYKNEAAQLRKRLSQVEKLYREFTAKTLPPPPSRASDGLRRSEFDIGDDGDDNNAIAGSDIPLPPPRLPVYTNNKRNSGPSLSNAKNNNIHKPAAITTASSRRTLSVPTAAKIGKRYPAAAGVNSRPASRK